MREYQVIFDGFSMSWTAYDTNQVWQEAGELGKVLGVVKYAEEER